MGKIGFVHDEGHFFSFDSNFFFKTHYGANFDSGPTFKNVK